MLRQRVVLTGLLVLAASASAWAQATGTITGRVVDQADAILPGVTVNLKNVETGQWALALKKSSEELKTKIFGNLSTRAADMLREEMEYLGPTKLSEVERVQQQIVDVVRRLEDAGEVTVHAVDEEETIIV